MHHTFFALRGFGRVAASTALAWAVAGCATTSGNPPLPAPAEPHATRESAIARRVPGDLHVTARAYNDPAVPRTTFVANAIASAVYAYGPSGKLAATITQGVRHPNGVFVDQNLNLWIANASSIGVYPRGAMKPNRTLTDPGMLISDVCVAADGTAYVANFFQASGYSQTGPGSVSVYRPNHTSPDRVLHDAQAQYLVGVATDNRGNVFATINDFTGVSWIDEFAGGKQSGFKRLPAAFSFAGTIRYDAAGNLMVLDELQHAVSEYTTEGVATGYRLNTQTQWNGFDIAASTAYIAGTESRVENDRVALRTFPNGKLVRYITNPGFSGGLSGIAFSR